jgi:hypothetical protein
VGCLGLGSGRRRGRSEGLEGGRFIVGPVEVLVIVMLGEVRRCVRRDCTPSRAVAWRVVSRVGRGRDRSWAVGGSGFGSVVVRYEGVKV